jgi:type IV secretory pathway VirB9-like protein
LGDRVHFRSPGSLSYHLRSCGCYSSISHQAAPALVALANDGSWFSRPSSQIVNYRVMGNRYVVDAALDRAALISGVGGSQERVVISRGSGCR